MHTIHYVASVQPNFQILSYVFYNTGWLGKTSLALRFCVGQYYRSKVV